MPNADRKQKSPASLAKYALAIGTIWLFWATAYVSIPLHHKLASPIAQIARYVGLATYKRELQEAERQGEKRPLPPVYESPRTMRVDNALWDFVASGLLIALGFGLRRRVKATRSSDHTH
jgi:hypothetical protein